MKNVPLLNRLTRIYLRLSPWLALPTALGLLLFFLPLMVLIALAVRLQSNGPVFFRQVRLGQNGKPFVLVKFRTMIAEAEAGGPQWAQVKDPRVTKLGEFLRASHLDELPQLWNVILMQMAFVGPRPERPEYYEYLRERIPNFHLRLAFRPGITGWAQIKEGYASSVEDSQRKIAADLHYFSKVSPLFDAWIILQTLRKFFPSSSLPTNSRTER